MLSSFWLVGAVVPAGQCTTSATNHETAVAQDDILGQKVDPAGGAAARTTAQSDIRRHPARSAWRQPISRAALYFRRQFNMTMDDTDMKMLYVSWPGIHVSRPLRMT